MGRWVSRWVGVQGLVAVEGLGAPGRWGGPRRWLPILSCLWESSPCDGQQCAGLREAPRKGVPSSPNSAPRPSCLSVSRTPPSFRGGQVRCGSRRGEMA